MISARFYIEDSGSELFDDQHWHLDMVDDILGNASCNKRREGSFTAVAHNDQVDTFFFNYGSNHIARDADLQDRGEMNGIGNQLLRLIKHDSGCFPDICKTVFVQVDLKKRVGSFGHISH